MIWGQKEGARMKLYQFLSNKLEEIVSLKHSELFGS